MPSWRGPQLKNRDSFTCYYHYHHHHHLPMRDSCPAHLILLDLITLTILGEEYRI
jgi:hypothetical protein